MGGLSAVGLMSLGCGDDKKAGGDKKASGDKKAAGADAKSCDATFDAKSKQMRKTLQYKDKAGDAAKACEKCAQYEKGKFGDCGGCKLFAGPVQPAGTCLSFAAMPGGDAAPSAAPSATATG